MIGTLVWVWGSALTKASPAWWRSVRPSDPAVIEAARRFEEAVVSQLHAVRADSGAGDGAYRSEPWSVGLSPADINAWLNVRFPRWIEGRAGIDDWPAEVSQIQVAFDGALIHVGAMVTHEGRSRVVSATVEATIDDEGRLWLVAERVRLGRLGVPAGWLLNELESGELIQIDDDVDVAVLVAILRGDRPAVEEPTHRLSDGRSVRLIAMRAARGRLGVMCQTE